MAGLLNMADKADWRNCEFSKDEETEMADKFKSGFKEFDPNSWYSTKFRCTVYQDCVCVCYVDYDLLREPFEIMDLFGLEEDNDFWIKFFSTKFGTLELCPGGP